MKKQLEKTYKLIICLLVTVLSFSCTSEDDGSNTLEFITPNMEEGVNLKKGSNTKDSIAKIDSDREY